MTILTTFIIGAPQRGLKIGFVNEENINCTNLTEYDCKSNGLSCLYQKEISDEYFIKIPYNSSQNAMNDLKMGKIVGFVHIPANYSVEFMELRKFSSRKFTKKISVYVDPTKLHQKYQAINELSNSYNVLIDKVMPMCNRPAIYYKSQLLVQDLDDNEIVFAMDFRKNMVPIMSML